LSRLAPITEEGNSEIKAPRDLGQKSPPIPYGRCLGIRLAFGAEDDRLKAAIKRVGREGPFTADQALEYVLSTGAAHDAADAAAILGYLRRRGDDLPQWEVACE
jgi:hypothetical protein